MPFYLEHEQFLKNGLTLAALKVLMLSKILAF